MSYTDNIKHLPDDEEHWIYLVWGIGKFADGSIAELLYAIDTTREKAELHKEMANTHTLGWPKIDNVFIEKRWTNHFFGQSMPSQFLQDNGVI